MRARGVVCRATVLVFLALFVTSGCCCNRWGKSEKDQIGYASWYGGKFHGRKTANGETYNMYALTAAHRTLPFGTRVKVTNLSNGKSVIVRITDRGPFVDKHKRVIDLSYAAAKKIDMIGQGVAKVRLEILDSK